MRNDAIFVDHGPDLTEAERRTHVRMAHRAALEAQKTFSLTARRQYRRYRDRVGDMFLAWVEWQAEYEKAYHGFRANFSANQWGGTPPGGEAAGFGAP